MSGRMFIRKFPFSNFNSIISSCEAFFNEVVLTQVKDCGCPIVKMVGTTDDIYEFYNKPTMKFKKGRYVEDYPNWITYNVKSYERTKPNFVWLSYEDILRLKYDYVNKKYYRYWMERENIRIMHNSIVQSGEIYVGCYF